MIQLIWFIDEMVAKISKYRELLFDKDFLWYLWNRVGANGFFIRFLDKKAYDILKYQFLKLLFLINAQQILSRLFGRWKSSMKIWEVSLKKSFFFTRSMGYGFFSYVLFHLLCSLESFDKLFEYILR